MQINVMREKCVEKEGKKDIEIPKVECKYLFKLTSLRTLLGTM
jgi:hypothetical protein